MRGPDIVHKWAVITPVYEDRESFARLCGELGTLDIGAGLYVIGVDDGSLDAAPDLSAITQAGLEGEILRLDRNVGHQLAISVGLAHVAGDDRFAGCIVMDCDGEDRPADIERLMDALADKDIDIAVAERGRRTESANFRLFYVVYRHLFRALTGQVIRFGNFMAFRPNAVARIAGMQEAATHIAGAVVKSRLRRANVPTDRGDRYHGQTKMNFVSLVLHGMRAVTVFGDAVLIRMALVLVLMAWFSIVSVGTALSLKLAGMTAPGWVTTVTGFMLSILLQTGVLTMITMVMNGMARLEPPTVVIERARAFVRDVEKTAVEEHQAEAALKALVALADRQKKARKA